MLLSKPNDRAAHWGARRSQPKFSARCLASLAQLKEEQTRLDIVQLIAAVAEYPPGREKLEECRAKLKELIVAKEDYALVAEFALIALQVIDWIP